MQKSIAVLQTSILVALLSGNARAADPFFVACSEEDQQPDIRSAHVTAMVWVDAANTYMGDGGKDSPILTEPEPFEIWFDPKKSDFNVATVRSTFGRLETGIHDSVTVNCAGLGADCDDPLTLAWVRSADTQEHRINLCAPFWKLAPSAPSGGSGQSRAEVLVHEQAHFRDRGDCLDSVCDSDSCKALAASDPVTATRNAYNYGFFAQHLHGNSSGKTDLAEGCESTPGSTDGTNGCTMGGRHGAGAPLFIFFAALAAIAGRTARRMGVSMVRYLTALSLLAALIGLGCFATAGPAVAQSPDTRITVTVELPSTVGPQDPVSAIVSLKNNTTLPLRVLRWYTPWDGSGLGTLMRVTNPDGTPARYVGIKKSYDVGATPPAQSYLEIAPGEKISKELDLRGNFDLSIPGEHTVDFVGPLVDVIEGKSDRPQDAAHFHAATPVHTPVTFRVVNRPETTP